jgi:protein-disulfide isomerase-like protein with CxxC motif
MTPSSKCQQVSLVMGELFNDVKLIVGGLTQEQTKLLLKQLSAYALQLDQIIQQAESDCFTAGWEKAKVKEQKDADNATISL